jgi:hypothetical protein
MEFSKILAQIHTPSVDCVFGAEEYLQLPADANAPIGCYVNGVSFEENSGVQRTVSGIDTQSSNMIVKGQCSAQVGAAYVMDSFVLYDLIIESDFSSGQVSFSR